MKRIVFLLFFLVVIIPQIFLPVHTLAYSQTNISRSDSVFSESYAREFRGFFPNNSKDVVRIYIAFTDSALTGELQIERRPQKSRFQGRIDSEGNFVLKEITSLGQFSGDSVSGKIYGETMEAYYAKRGIVYNFEFYEIDMANPPAFQDGRNPSSNEASIYFTTMSQEFTEIQLPFEFNFDIEAKELENYGEFVNKNLIRYASNQENFTLTDRVEIAQSITKIGKVVFPSGNIGFAVQVYYEAGMDGELYEIYMYIYSPKGEFKNGFVVFQALDEERIVVNSTLTSSYIFMVRDLGKEHLFKLHDDGSFWTIEH